MAFSAFDDPARPPAPDALRRALGPSARLWSDLLARARSLGGPLAERWKHGGARSGWSLRVTRGDRVILYLTPHPSSFSVGVVLGERAAEAALETELPPLAREALEAAPRHVEGRGVRIAVSGPRHLEAVLALLPHKVARPSRLSRKTSLGKRAPGRHVSVSGTQPAVVAPALLAGGNPQVAKGDGDGPVQIYLAAIPGWRRDVGRRLDALVVREVPKVRKAIRWNSPFYGLEGRGWFLAFHVHTRYVKVTFFRGASLRPAPPGGEGKDARWVDVGEDDLDEAQMARWIRQAAALPGWGKV